MELKKDTEKMDNLKSMVQAWETAQPGRCKEAQESRKKFLESRAIREKGENENELNSTPNLIVEGGVPNINPLHPNTGPVKIWQMDLTPFIM